MAGDLAGRVTVVTGGASGIGFAAAKKLADEGAILTIADLDVSSGEEAAMQLSSEGADVTFVRCDISDEADVEALIEGIVSKHGRLDGAVNNAGVPPVGLPLHEVATEDFERNVAVNVTGTFFCLKYEISAMLASGGGSIVNMASAAGLVGIPLHGEYIAAKHGVVGLTKVAAIDYGVRGIRVNAIAPGSIRTPMLMATMAKDPSIEPALNRSHPIGRFGEPTEVGDAVAWLLSSHSSFVTGVTLPVDGGYTAI
jgi:2,5-dichloro-2,5-cyclohexadiene-1,4-diol dehydrogenase 1